VISSLSHSDIQQLVFMYAQLTNSLSGPIELLCWNFALFNYMNTAK